MKKNSHLSQALLVEDESQIINSTSKPTFFSDTSRQQIKIILAQPRDRYLTLKWNMAFYFMCRKFFLHNE
jgi:hypothetical protein